MPGLYTGATGLWGGFAGLLYGSSALSTPPGLLADAGGFTPASLFAQGEQGVWYDPSDFSTMFQDSAGTTPVTAVEQPVGLILDKSQGLVLGSELAATGVVGITGAATAATYNTGTGAGTATRVDAFNQSFVSVSVTSGKTYLISLQNTGATSIAVRPSSLGSALLLVSTGQSVQARITATDGAFNVCSSGTGSVQFILNSVKLLSGNHATQATSSASRPVLSARVNQLLATATLATQSVTTLAATYTLSFSGAGTVTATGTNIGVYSAGSNSLVCTAGTLTLTVVGSVTLADLRVTNTGVGLPSYQAVVTSTDYDTTGFPYYLRFDGTDDFLSTASINPGAGVKAQMFAGVRAETPRSNNSPVWQFGDTTTTATDAMMRILTGSGSTDAYRAMLFGSGANQTSSVTKVVPYTAVFSTLYDAAVTGANEISLRENGVVTAVGSATDSGLTSFGSQILYIGRQATAAGYLNGNLYSLIVRFGANLDATTISNTETYVNSKTLAY